MNLTEEYIKDMEKKLELMKAFLNGKTLQFKERYLPEECWKTLENPLWDFLNYDYRIKPEEPEESKKLMTYRQLSELITKGYGQWLYNYDNAVMGKNTLFIDKEVNENILIRPWGLNKLVRPTVDIYEEFMKRKAEEDTIKDYSGASKVESTTASEDSSSTQGECIGVHKRTPQEIADFFGCYVAMDKDGLWYLYEGKPMVCEGRWKVGDTGDCRCLGYSGKFFFDIPQSSNWRTLYRPHREPIVMEDEDD